jgi:hypothetical protein
MGLTILVFFPALLPPLVERLAPPPRPADGFRLGPETLRFPLEKPPLKLPPPRLKFEGLPEGPLVLVD